MIMEHLVVLVQEFLEVHLGLFDILCAEVFVYIPREACALVAVGTQEGEGVLDLALDLLVDAAGNLLAGHVLEGLKGALFVVEEVGMSGAILTHYQVFKVGGKCDRTLI